MAEIQMHLPSSFSTKRGKIETKIIDYSNTLFKNFKFGLLCILLINGIYLYYCYYKKPILEFCLFFCFSVLIIHIVIYQLKGNK